MILKYLLIMIISMIPIVELRGAVPIGISMGLHPILTIMICVIGNMLPVPVIHIFARKFLIWGSKQKFIDKICSFFIRKGERASAKLLNNKNRYGTMLALMIFVGLPLPGTGAWTGTLGASFLGLDFKTTCISVVCGVIFAGVVMTVLTLCGLHIFGL